MGCGLVSADVVALKPRSDGEAREAFLATVGASFDQYVENHGFEPEALVTVWCGLKLPSQSHWLIRGASEGGGASILALAQATIAREFGDDNGE
jgi:hypothetical protein